MNFSKILSAYIKHILRDLKNKLHLQNYTFFVRHLVMSIQQPGDVNLRRICAIGSKWETGTNKPHPRQSIQHYKENNNRQVQ
jgi:hypothetical protein